MLSASAPPPRRSAPPPSDMRRRDECMVVLDRDTIWKSGSNTFSSGSLRGRKFVVIAQAIAAAATVEQRNTLLFFSFQTRVGLNFVSNDFAKITAFLSTFKVYANISECSASLGFEWTRTKSPRESIYRNSLHFVEIGTLSTCFYVKTRMPGFALLRDRKSTLAKARSE